MQLAMRPILRMRWLVLATLLGGLGGCTGERGGLGAIVPSAGSTPGHAATGPRPGSIAAVNMTGRWVLATPNAGFCNMTFAGAAGATEGTIAPEGGCPGNFFTSRKWALEPSGLVIRNHNGEPLAQLSSSEQGRLEGQATTGESVTLTR